MAEHANGYLTLTVRISQGTIVDSLSPILDRRGQCSTALRGMPRTALALECYGLQVTLLTDCNSGAIMFQRHKSDALSRGRRLFSPEACSLIPLSYFSSTAAPASSSCAFKASASSRLRASLTGFGASSTRVFASFRPRPVAALTTFMTWIFFSPGPWSTTSNSVCSSSAAAAPSPATPAAGAAATAVAETPKRSSRAFTSSESSRTVMFSIDSISSSLLSAICGPPIFVYLRLFGALLLLGDLAERHDQTLDGVVEHRDQPRERGGDAADDLGEQLLAARQLAQGHYIGLAEHASAFQEATLERERLHLVGELRHQLSAGDRVLREGESRGPDEELRDPLYPCLVRGPFGKGVFRDHEVDSGLAAAPTEVGAPGNVHALVVDEHSGACAQLRGEALDHPHFLFPVQSDSSTTRKPRGRRGARGT